MKIVEIQSLQNGGHRNQCHEMSFVPEGWAVVPDSLETKNFPFGRLVCKTIDGVKTVTSWTPGIIPKEETEPEETTTE